MLQRLRRTAAPLRGGAKTIVRALADAGIVWPWPWLCERATVEITTPVSDDHRPVVLALRPERFRGDLAALADTGHFRVIYLRDPWLGRIVELFGIFECDAGRVGRVRQRNARMMRNVVKGILARLNVDLVIGASFWYRGDIPWGSTAQALGYPYLVLHRECLYTEAPQQQWFAETIKHIGDFTGHAVLTQNEPARKIFIDSGVVSPNAVVNCGCLRMDEFVKRARAAASVAGGVGSVDGTEDRTRRKVTFFSFTTGIGLNGLANGPMPLSLFAGWFRLFELSHVAFAQLAHAMPDVDFVIKTKWEGTFYDLIRRAFEANGVASDIPNLTITASGDAADLIFSSDVVCGFASTTVLEAGIAGKPVVVPAFEEALRAPYDERVKLSGYRDLFDFADSPKAFIATIVKHLEGSRVLEREMTQRWEAFDTWVSDTAAGAVEKYIDVFDRANDWGRQRRASISAATTPME